MVLGEHTRLPFRAIPCRFHSPKWNVIASPVHDNLTFQGTWISSGFVNRFGLHFGKMPLGNVMAEPVVSTGNAIRVAMESKGWSQRELALVLGKPLAAVSELLQGKRSLSTEMAILVSQAFGKTPEYWLGIEASYRVSLSVPASNQVAERARLFELAPIKDLAKRGWIGKADTAEALDAELCKFFGVSSLTETPQIAASARKTSSDTPMNSAQRAWCFRAVTLAKALSVGVFSVSALEKAVCELQKLVAWPEETRRVPRILAEAGIRFVVIEPLPHTRMDGVATWINGSPLIAMSLRYDRIDNFWHVLGHELSHIRHRDDAGPDVDLVGDNLRVPGTSGNIEERAELEAAETWVPPRELGSFINRVGPLYSRARINQLANKLQIHPGVIVGQLQGRGEIGWNAFADMKVKVRQFVVSEALTDGWGQTTPL